MPKKAAAADTEVVRRKSSRIAEKADAAPPAPAKKAPAKKAPAKKEAAPKKGKAKKEEEEDHMAEDSEEPAAKKRKADDEEEEEEPVAEKKNGAKKAKKEEAPAPVALKEGDSLPADLSALDQDGNSHVLLDLAKDNGIVIFFYPKADTPGCTKQACGFRDNYEVIHAKGYTVYGLSGDKPAAQTKFINKFSLGYTLLSDVDHKVIKAFGIAKGKSVARSHVIIEKGGVIKTLKSVGPLESVQEVVKIVGGTYVEPKKEDKKKKADE
ncbi:hypothetical protein HDU97_001971 [Phlyctochytrium planicorne]|nr:hypothetical protein HDU97_001971 [Phlyctochytrium planicorne]